MQKVVRLSVIIVSYNTAHLTTQAVQSVLDSFPEAEIIIVDNHSSDDSVAMLRDHFGTRVQVMVNRENVGFARANNQGAAFASGKYILLLNSDTIVHTDALDTLVRDLEFDGHIGAVTAALQNKDGSYQPQGGALPTLSNLAAWWLWPFPGSIFGIASYQDRSEPTLQGLCFRGWVGGTALTMRRQDYQVLGGLDERIFMYAEDIDLCLRIRKMGLAVAIDPRAHITHLGSASGSRVKARLGEVRGLLYLFKKHRPRWCVWGLRVILLKGSLLRFLFFGILENSVSARELYRQTAVLALQG